MARMTNLGTFYGDNARAFDLYCCVDCGVVVALTLSINECVVCGLRERDAAMGEYEKLRRRVNGEQLKRETAERERDALRGVLALIAEEDPACDWDWEVLGKYALDAAQAALAQPDAGGDA